MSGSPRGGWGKGGCLQQPKSFPHEHGRDQHDAAGGGKHRSEDHAELHGMQPPGALIRRPRDHEDRDDHAVHQYDTAANMEKSFDHPEPFHSVSLAQRRVGSGRILLVEIHSKNMALTNPDFLHRLGLAQDQAAAILDRVMVSRFLPSIRINFVDPALDGE